MVKNKAQMPKGEGKNVGKRKKRGLRRPNVVRNVVKNENVKRKQSPRRWPNCQDSQRGQCQLTSCGWTPIVKISKKTILAWVSQSLAKRLVKFGRKCLINRYVAIFKSKCDLCDKIFQMKWVFFRNGKKRPERTKRGTRLKWRNGGPMVAKKN